MKSFFKSFSYAFRGIAYCLKNERNMRIHCVVAAYVFVFSGFFHFGRIEYAVLFLAFALVIAAEMLNTAVEGLVNIQIPAYDTLARLAKDVAAGAVLVCALFSVGVGIVLFWKPAVFADIFRFFVQHPAMIVLLVISVVLALIFICAGPNKIKKAKHIRDRLEK
jgi:diacylglycerol kinase